MFIKHALPAGTFRHRGELITPQHITRTALLTIEGELDDISGQGQTRAAHRLCTGIPERERRHLTIKGAGHYGIFSGRRWREQVYPQVRDFIAANVAHDDAAPRAKAKAAPAKRAAKASAAAKPATKPAKKAAKKVARQRATRR